MVVLWSFGWFWIVGFLFVFVGGLFFFFMCFVCVGGCVFCCVLGLGFGVECFLFWEMGCGWKGGCFFVCYVLYVCGEFGVKLFVDDLFLGWGFVCSRVVFLL